VPAPPPGPHGALPAFDEAPPAARRRAFGVDYLAIRGMQGGELYFTRAGWARAPSLLPRVWFDNERFLRIGKALQKATGSVYLVPVPHPARGRVGVVVKFCRFGQDVGCTRIEPGLLPAAVAPLVSGAEFAGPFEEFGLLARLRAFRGPHGERFRTKIPLVIYCPPTRYVPWRLGRDQSRCWRHDRVLADGQESMPPSRRIVHHWDRIYVMLYQWIEGIDLEEAGANNLLTEEEVGAFTMQVARDLLAAGFAVTDHKARHIIVRPDPGSGRLVRRGGRIACSLIDYELLMRVAELPAAGLSPSQAP
jgi:hypothetical protein